MKNTPLVSVVIPVYNCEKYICDTVESVIRQTYENIEVVIVNDGSTDRSREKVEQLQIKYPNKIKYIYQENSGVSVARNNGIASSSGEYVAFLDSDDLWEKSKLEKQVERMLETNMPACYCGYMEWYDKSDRREKVKFDFSEGNILISYLMWKTWGQTSTWIIKRDLIINSGIEFTPKSSWGEDFEFFIKVISMSEICIVKEFLTFYRIRENESLTNKNLKSLELTEVEVWERLKKWFADNVGRLNSMNLDQAVSLIDSYRIPRAIINPLYYNVKDNISRARCIELYEENHDKINKFKLINTKDSYKLLIKKKLLEFNINKK